MNCERPRYAPGTSTGLARCGRWRCEGCAEWLSRIETRALQNERSPGALCFLTVTTRDPDTPLQAFVRAFQTLSQRLRRQFGPMEYYGTIEGTTGRYARDRRRRMHGHFVLRFGGCESLDEKSAQDLARSSWEASTLASMGEGGRSFGVTLESVRSVEALGAYVAGYMGKREQIMDADWGGRRIRCSQGYFADGRVVARERAKGQLIGEARAWREGFPRVSQGYEALSAAGGESFVLKREAALALARSRAELATVIALAPVVHDAVARERDRGHLQLFPPGESVLNAGPDEVLRVGD